MAHPLAQLCTWSAAARPPPGWPPATQPVSVTYLSSSNFRAAIEATGAVFVDEATVLTEFFQAADNYSAASQALMAEFGCDSMPFHLQNLKLGNVRIERQLPRLLQQLADRLQQSAEVRVARDGRSQPQLNEWMQTAAGARELAPDEEATLASFLRTFSGKYPIVGRLEAAA